MTQAAPFQAVFELEAALGASWPHIRQAYHDTIRLHERVDERITDLTGEDATIVVFGSLGRFEVTAASDIDWTYLIDGQADLKHQKAALDANKRIEALGEELGKKKPGREGVFGAMAFSHDIVQYIGGENDTNTNLTRRILLLLESTPIGRRDAYDRVIRVVLERYLTGDHGWIRARNPHSVPRFLLNDISRYWRTIAVDFAYKQWTRDSEGWALKSAKLRMSRKLLYGAGLLYCFSLASDIWKQAPRSETARKLEAIERLAARTARAPLDLLAEAFKMTEALQADAARAFTAYDEFLALLNSAEDRGHLLKLLPKSADDDARYQRVRELGGEFEQALMQLFIRNELSPFRALTETYGVF